MSCGGRTAKIILCPEARVLRELRESLGLSMREAGEKMGYSPSYISQIENGREDVPSDERLTKFLKAYGVNKSQFSKRVRSWKGKVTDLDIVLELLPKLKKDQVHVIRHLVEQLLKGD